MPKMTLTEEEASHIRKHREVKAMQAVAWNEALDAALWLIDPQIEPGGLVETVVNVPAFRQRIEELKRKP